ncbi:hypothetical protein C8R43DRAFT_944062 [Mycena crocata]|nr:hypothetical protein C8R43DRAFT_944062 [Mycena crocata]
MPAGENVYVTLRNNVRGKLQTSDVPPFAFGTLQLKMGHPAAWAFMEENKSELKWDLTTILPLWISGARLTLDAANALVPAPTQALAKGTPGVARHPIKFVTKKGGIDLGDQVQDDGGVDAGLVGRFRGTGMPGEAKRGRQNQGRSEHKQRELDEEFVVSSSHNSILPPNSKFNQGHTFGYPVLLAVYPWYGRPSNSDLYTDLESLQWVFLQNILFGNC